MPRSIWNGVISFGMVSIPVKLYTATESKDISFNLLHRQCNTRLKQLRYCPTCDRNVEWGETMRGYEYAKEQYVVLEEKDLEGLPLPSRRTIELSAFVEAEAVDPIYYEKSYYLEPEEAGVKPYALLMRALTEKKRAALAKIALRHKEQICVLRPRNGTLLLETLFYPHEIRLGQAQLLPQVTVSEQELAMALSFIDILAQEFDPGRYRDEYREALMEVIEAKLQGQEIVAAPAAPAQVTDLVAALKASIEAAKKQNETPAARPAPRPAAKRRQAAG